MHHQRQPRQDSHSETQIQANLEHALGELELAFSGLVLAGHR